MIMNTMQAQLELGLNGQAATARMEALGRRTSRARWWFQQMHAAVDSALDWSTSPDPRPEKISLTLAKAQ